MHISYVFDIAEVRNHENMNIYLHKFIFSSVIISTYQVLITPTSSSKLRLIIKVIVRPLLDKVSTLRYD